MIMLRRVVPNEKWQLILGTDGMRLCAGTVASVDKREAFGGVDE